MLKSTHDLVRLACVALVFGAGVLISESAARPDGAPRHVTTALIDAPVLVASEIIIRPTHCDARDLSSPPSPYGDLIDAAPAAEPCQIVQPALKPPLNNSLRLASANLSG